MKVLSQKREGNKLSLEVEEDYSRFQQSYRSALTEAGKEVRIPGFRPGKAPQDLVEKALNLEAVEHHAAQDLIADLYPSLIDEAKIDPVDYPSVEISQLEKDKPFVFKLSVEVYPAVELGKYKGVKIEKKPVELKEDEVLQVLGRLQERFAVTNAEGEKERLPLDDAFAKKVSHFGTLAELKEELNKTMLKEKQAEAEADLKNKAIAAAAAETKVDIPPAMVEREIDVMLDELKTSLAQSRLTLEDYLKGVKKEEKALREEMRKSAEIRVKGKIVLKAVVEAEKIKVTPEEVQAEIKAITEEAEKVSAEMKKYIEDYLLRKKALDFIIEKASIKEG